MNTIIALLVVPAAVGLWVWWIDDFRDGYRAAILVLVIEALFLAVLKIAT